MKNQFLMLIIGLFFGAGFGFLISAGPLPSGHDHASHEGHHVTAPPAAPEDITPAAAPAGMSPMMPHDHSDTAENGAPVSVDFEAFAEGEGSVNLHILTTDFRFAPNAVNTMPKTGEGHAHVYVDGEKMARAYGPWINLTGLDPGKQVTIRVTLNANNHQPLTQDGTPVEAWHSLVVK
ncbi:hypothetical protein [Pseudooceanicola algae]|uniref:DUF4399 domain-containing protein n=1 Tax=Pseudooceanicola algae TaxID=1537215 RepID=A0A7T1BV70_9RHOB|nr:hypothetical protein [Pseudooceanicola algae]QPM91043.1 hypothetical protein PSAL_022860 [Pseudooceanicola algae]